MKFYLSLAAVVLSLLSCTPAQEQAPVIREMLYPSEVPAFFDTVLMIRASDLGDNKMQVKWSSENGTIKGEGESIVWTAPAVYGIYNLRVKVSDATGRQTMGLAGIKVVPFYQTQVDPDPEIYLKLPVWGSSVMGEQSLIGTLTNAEIICEIPSLNIYDYKYEWSCNGGKIHGTGLKDGTASKIGWFAPGVPGNYTVTVKAVDRWGNIMVGSVYFQVKNPSCCPSPDTVELYRWKQ